MKYREIDCKLLPDIVDFNAFELSACSLGAIEEDVVVLLVFRVHLWQNAEVGNPVDAFLPVEQLFVFF